MKLLIRNLARSTTETELQTLFETYGKVQSCKLVIDKKTGQSKGFGFIEMPSPGQAKAATKNLNGEDVAGSKIRVKKAETKPGTGNTPPSEKVSKSDSDNPTNTEETGKTTLQDPLHGITLETVVSKLKEKYGWEELGDRINIKCFTSDPSISSSLKFLRKTPWAREKVEALYLDTNWTTSNVWNVARKKKNR